MSSGSRSIRNKRYGEKKSTNRKTTQPKGIRLKKARQWILAYNGTPKHIFEDAEIDDLEDYDNDNPGANAHVP